jgi:RNA processing factor Prp31
MNTYLKEITDWKFPSNTYIVNKKMELVGYIKEGTKEEIIFKTPMKNFSKSWRKFTTA